LFDKYLSELVQITGFGVRGLFVAQAIGHGEHFMSAIGENILQILIEQIIYELSPIEHI